MNAYDRRSPLRLGLEFLALRALEQLAMSNVHVVSHPLVQHKLTLMRDKTVSTKGSASFSTRSACCSLTK